MPNTLSIGVVILQAGIAVILVEAIRRRHVPAFANALVSLAATLVPLAAVVGWQFATGERLVIGSELPLWIAAAGLLHSYGMLGPYDTVRWWDTLTHMVSAALVAALIYGILLAVARPSGDLVLSTGTVAVLTVIVTLGLGLLWELIELAARWIGDRYGVEPVLVHYGWRDTAIDLVIDGIGALIVVVLDVRTFVSIFGQV